MAVLNFDIKSVQLPTGDEAKAVFLTGSIDASTNQTFEGKLGELLSSGNKHVMLVLTNVKYINSTGLGTIVKCVDNFREKGGDIKLVGVPTKVIALFEMLGLLALFETHDTIEAAVASFGKGKAAAAAAAQPAAKFPIQFKHPVTGMGLNVSQPGKFKDPRSGDYFSIDQAGTIEFYEMSRVKMVEVRVPADLDFASAVGNLAQGVAQKCSLPAAVGDAIVKGLEQAGQIIARGAKDPGETCNVLIVGDSEKLQVGIVNHGRALNVTPDHPSLKAMQASLDEVKHQVLPTRGFLLSLTKKA